MAAPAVQLARLPWLAQLFVRALALAAVRRQGGARVGDELPALAVSVPGVRVDPARLAAYRAVCACADGGDGGDVLPPAFPETLFIGLLAKLVTARGFPLSPLGLIHVRQTLVEHAPIHVSEALALACRLEALRSSARGVEVDWRMEVQVGGRLAWEGCATMLSRSRTARGVTAPPGARSPHPPVGGAPPLAIVDVPEPTGRRYALASGDWNPHHLWALTARPIGYRRPIAHGMWTLARLLAELARDGCVAGLLDAEVAFKQPIAMPGRVALFASRASDAGGAALDVTVRPADGEGLHLVGRVAHATAAVRTRR